MRKLAILIGGAVALAACSTTPPPPPAPPDINNVLLAPGFLAHAGSANQYEIEAAQIALQASANPAVRNLANVIIADHTAMGQRSPLRRLPPASLRRRRRFSRPNRRCSTSSAPPAPGRAST